MRKTIITAWTSDWNEMYAIESRNIRIVLGSELIDIEHIGSTSVSHIGYAKPIIDILVVVNNIETIESYNEAVSKLGYSIRGDQGIKGRRYFTKGGDHRTHHVHVYEFGHKNIQKHLDFKRYLLANPEEARKYGQLKVQLAEKFPDNTHQYQEAKESFVNILMEKAIRWASL